MSKKQIQTTILILAITIGTFGTFLIGWTQTESMEEIQQGIAKEVLRFHVRANSDSQKDQQIKMQVKEQVVSYLESMLSDVENVQETKERVRKQLPEIEEQAEKVLTQEGYDYGVHAAVGKSDFPEKTYGDCRFPAGTYEALIIELGTGKGNNWWCMLYPSLCFFNESYGIVTADKKEKLKSVLTDTEFLWITDWDKVRIGFKWF